MTKKMSSAPARPSNDPPPTSSGQHLIMKDQSKIKRAVRKTQIIVNSRDRNLISYPSPSQFRITFRRPLTNILSLELMDGCIPTQLYTMNTDWNKFTVLEYNRRYTITLIPGIYTEATLVTELQRALNNGVATMGAPSQANIYTVTQDPITRKIAIQATSFNAPYTAICPYTLLFFSGDYRDTIDLKTTAVLSINTPARQLGFGLNDYVAGATTHTVSAPLPMDLDNFLNRIYIHINGDNSQTLHRMEMSNGRSDCYHMLVFQPNAQQYLFLDKQMDMPVYESSPAPISRMSGLEISFRDEFDRLVDFQGREVNLVFEITHLE